MRLGFAKLLQSTVLRGYALWHSILPMQTLREGEVTEPGCAAAACSHSLVFTVQSNPSVAMLFLAQWVLAVHDGEDKGAQ